MKTTLILLFLTLGVALLPFGYVMLTGSVHEELRLNCLNLEDADKHNYTLCISCFINAERDSEDDSEFSGFAVDKAGYLAYSGVKLTNKMISDQVGGILSTVAVGAG